MWRQQSIQNCTFLWANLKDKTSHSSVVMLRLLCTFIFWLSVGNDCFKFSNFEILILKYLKKFCLASFRRSIRVWNYSSSACSCSKHVMNTIRSFYSLSFFSKQIKPTCIIASSSQLSMLMTVKSGSSRRSVKLSDSQFGIFRLPRGLSRRTRHCRSTACVTERDTARQGHGMLCVN